MKVLRGKYKGRTARIHQAANDWVMADIQLDDGTTKTEVMNPTSLAYDPDDVEVLKQHADGQFWRWYSIVPADGDPADADMVRLKAARR